MKNKLNLMFTIFIALLLITISVTVMGCVRDPIESGEAANTRDSTKTEETEETEENEEDKDSLSIAISNVYLWGTDNGSYDSSSKKLVLINGYKGANLYLDEGEDFATDIDEYKYVKFTYENLDLPNVNLRLHYKDGTYSEVALQDYKTTAYIELDGDRKTDFDYLSLMSRQGPENVGKESLSLTIKGVSFVKEKVLEKKAAIVDKSSGSFDDSISALELSDKIALGFSLGSGLSTCPFYNNPLCKYTGFGFQNNYDKDGNPLIMNLLDQSVAFGNQTTGLAIECSGIPPLNKEFIDAVRDMGYKSIRICATWYPYIIDKNYTIDPDFMAYVKKIVDWALDDGLYVILNEHHSVHAYCPSPLGYADGYNLAERDRAESERYLKRIYEQISAAFNGSYDERLIFETLNEPRVIQEDGTELWKYDISDSDEKAGTEILNDYNQLIVDTIRASGGNNAKRFIMVPTYATDWNTVDSSYFELPSDTATDKLMVAIHKYPLLFNSKDGARKDYTEEIRTEISTCFKKAYDRFILKGIPVTITEFNIENAGEYYEKYWGTNNSDYSVRKECLTYFCQLAGKYRLSLNQWDDGYCHNIINRLTNQPYEGADDFAQDLISAWEEEMSYYANGAFLSPADKETLIQASLYSKGNNYRLKKVLEKIKAGEKVTCAAIGGSITEGQGFDESKGESYTDGYAYQFANKIRQKYYPDNEENFVLTCAGLSGTPSSLGAVRYLDDIINKVYGNPDILIVEFAVNDGWGEEAFDNKAFEVLIRNGISWDEKTCVIALYSVNKEKYNTQEFKIPVAEHYKVPQISMKNAIFESGLEDFDFDLYSADGTHPTKAGHEIMASCLMNLFTSVDGDSIDSQISLPDYYFGSKAFSNFIRVGNENSDPKPVISKGGFSSVDSQCQPMAGNDNKSNFTDNWKHSSDSDDNSAFEISLNCKSFIFVYKEGAFWSSEKFGKADLYVDGVLFKTLDGAPEGGWNNCKVECLFDNESSEDHTIKVQMASGDEDKNFTIVAMGYAY
ncbi:MAG: cellulase family glycosylhydrolase [Treponema sp.]|nr:cellulase family glycosylhydrolase [Treponema sp.]